MAKRVTVFCAVPGKVLSLMLVPFGMYANRGIQQCEIGAVITFHDAWRETKRRLVRRCRLPVASSVFSFLLKALYGSQMTFIRFMEHWQAIAISEGWGKDAFREDAVLLIELGEADT